MTPALVCLILAAAGAAAQTCAPRFVLNGEWSPSSLAGHQPGKRSYYTNQPGASAIWEPALRGAVRARVSFYAVVNANSNAAAKLEIFHAGRRDTATVDLAHGESGWRTLGDFPFAGRCDERVTLTHAPHTAFTRAAALRLDVLGEGRNPQVLWSLTLDDAMEADAQLLSTAPAVPGPPKGKNWQLSFSDEFNGSTLNRDAWEVESGSPSHILSSRWPENVRVSGGLLHLLTRKEERGGKHWTTGNIWTRFRQRYGYFECRMKIGAASGLNNAFWLMTPNRRADPVHFEIDITEAHYPREHTMTLHNWAGTHTATTKRKLTAANLSEDFHLYAVEWNAREITWYFDGRPVWRQPNTFCTAASPIRLSSAVLNFAGPISDALDGTEMQVDWVRVYAEK